MAKSRKATTDPAAKGVGFTPSQVDAASEFSMRYYRTALGLPEPTPEEVIADTAECREMIFGSPDVSE